MIRALIVSVLLLLCVPAYAQTTCGVDITYNAGSLLRNNNLADLPCPQAGRQHLGVDYGTTANTVVQGNDPRISSSASLAIPNTWSALQTFGGGAVGPTPAASDNSTAFASTAYVQRALPCYDPRLSGVKWDGVTDDTAAMTAAIVTAVAAGGAQGACVQLPRGAGVLGQINLPSFTNGLHIPGAGEGATNILLNSTSTNLFVSPPSNHNGFFEADHFQVTPPGPMTGGTTFIMDNVFGANIHDIKQFAGFNFLSAGPTVASAAVTNHGNNLRNFTGNVVSLGSGSDYRDYGNNYDSDSCAQATASCQPVTYFLDRNWSGVMLGNTDAIHCGSCYVINPNVAGEQVEWVFVTQAQADTSASAGWTLHAAAGTTIYGFHATQLWSSSHSADSVVIQQDAGGLIDDVSIAQPFVLNNVGVGIHFIGFTGKAYLTAPSIAGNSQVVPGANSGVFLDGGSGSINITGGVVGAFGVFGNTQSYNIQTSAAWTGQVSVANSNLCGSATGPFLNAGTGAFEIVNTACVNPGGTNPVTVGASPWTYQATIAPTTFNLFSGTITSVTVGGIQICNSSPCTGRAEPGQNVVVSYSATPSMIVTKD